MGFSFLAMALIFYNVFILINQKYYFKDSIPVIIFLIYATIIYSFNIDEKFSSSAYLHICGSILFYLVLVNLVDDFNVLSKMLLIHVVVVIPILLFMAYYSWFYWDSFWLSPDFESGSRFGKNTVGMFSVFCFTYLYGYFRMNKSIFVILGLLIIGLCALYTISRGTLIALILVVCLFPIISNKKVYYTISLSTIILSIFLLKHFFAFDYLETLLAIKNQGGTEHVQKKFIDFKSSSDGAKYGYGQRASHYITLVRKFPNKPLFGHGTESFRRNEGTLAHNDYITLIYEYGIIGIILYLYILWSHLYGLFKVRDLIVYNHRWLLESQMIQIIILMFTSLIMTMYLSPMIWYNLAISAVIVRITKDYARNQSVAI